MADIRIKSPDCNDDDDCKRGKRGKRGRQGPPGPSSGGLLKFSGLLRFGQGEIISFLADANANNSFFVNYPVAVTHSLRNLATNLLYTILPNEGTIVIDLLKNGIPVPGFSITYGPGETGIKQVLAGPEIFVEGPPTTFDLRITATDIFNEDADPINLSATIGVE